MPRILKSFAPLLSVLILTGCQSALWRGGPEPLPVTRAPEGCRARSAETPPILRLPKTESPARRGSKGEPLELAQVHTVNRPLQHVGVWTDYDDQWSLLSLQLGSEGARSIAVRLQDSALPPQTEIWLCALDRRVRQGPYREATGGELWTPVIPGEAALIEVWLPTAYKPRFKAQLADVYGGYR